MGPRAGRWFHVAAVQTLNLTRSGLLFVMLLEGVSFVASSTRGKNTSWTDFPESFGAGLAL